VTEEEWDRSRDGPTRMWEFVRASPRWTPRTLRLFVAAFWRRQASRLSDARREDTIRRAAGFEQWAETGRLPRPFRVSRSPNVIFFNASAEAAADMTVRAPSSAWESGWEAVLGPMTDFLRDIHGNPLRPPTIRPEWRTEAVVALAAGSYADRAFDRLPVLADALEDAGCDDLEVLGHCRGPGPHVRGCWVIDLVLGKK
jgi:hypothetical protein